MRKIKIFSILIMLSFCGMLFAETIPSNGKNKRLTVKSVSDEKMAGTNAAIIISEYLDNLFNKYTAFTLIDEKNSDLRKAEIKKSEGAAYDENLILEAGKNQAAEYFCIPAVEKTSRFFNITVSIQNVETGNVLAKRSCQSAENVIPKNLDKIFYEMIVEDLGFELTSRDTAELLHETEKEEDAEELERIAEELGRKIEENQRLLEEMTADKIKGLEEQQLEAMRQSAEQVIVRLKAEKETYENRARLKREDEARAAKAAEEAEKYSADQRKKAEKLQQQLVAIQNEMIKKNESEMHPEDYISLMEVQKKSLDKIIMDDLEFLIEQKAIDDAEHEAREDEIRTKFDDKSEYPSFYDEKGEMNSKGEAAIKKELAVEKKKYEKILSENTDLILNKTSDTEKGILSSIASESKDMSSEINTASSLFKSQNLTVRVGEYNGSEEAWPVDIVFIFNNTEVWRARDKVYYKDVTGEKLVAFGTSEEEQNAFKQFQENIILYDNMFRENLPLINFDVKYKVKPVEVSASPVIVRDDETREFKFYYPPADSTYTVSIVSYTIYRTEADGLKKIKNVDVNSIKSVDCAQEEGRYHLWNSETAWNLYNAGTKRIIGKEKREEKTREFKQKTTEKTEAFKSGVSTYWDQVLDNASYNTYSEKTFDISATFVPGTTILNPDEYSDKYEIYTGGFYLSFATMFPLNDFFSAGFDLDAGKVENKVLMGFFGQIDGHLYLAPKIALSGVVGLGVVIPSGLALELGTRVNFVIGDGKTIYGGYSAILSPARTYHNITAGYMFTIPDAVTDFFENLLNTY